jgi:diketogulonate reductase-like aldo/keto reductase
MTFDIPRYTLNDGQSVPVIGFGTYPLRGDEGVEAMVRALEAGYRLLDTAVNYGNEEEVGEAVRRSGLPREDVQVTSKIPGRHHEYDRAIGSVEESLRRLRFDYLDRVLIHWPNPGVGKYVEAWRALVELRNRGLVRSIGVSNFTEQHLHAVIEDTGVTPAVNQVELHPYFPQQELLRVHTDLGIQTEAWSPLGKRSAPFAEPPVSEPSERYGVTPAQVILRWHLQRRWFALPQSAAPPPPPHKLDLFGFELTDAEVDAITALARPDGRLFGGDPDNHEEM